MKPERTFKIPWLIAAFDESTQPLVQRTASVGDWFADCGGVCIAGLYNVCRNTS